MNKPNPKVKRKARNRKCQRPGHKLPAGMSVGPEDVCVSVGKDYALISASEYSELISNGALLLAVKRIVENDAFGRYGAIRTVLGMEPVKNHDSDNRGLK